MRADDEPAGTRRWYLAATPQATLPWLIRLRCATAGIEALTVVVVWFFPAWNLPLDHLTSLLIVAALTNVAIAVWLARGHSIPAPAATVAMLIEMSLLTGLLELTGGPLNPFTAIYAVQVLLAAVTLGAVWAWLLGGFAGVCYGVLVYWHLHELAPSHHRLNDSPTHLLIIWFSAAVIAELLRYVAIRVSEALEWREQVLEMMRTRAARTERLAALTTLAAGAAHELSTPLATIAVAACELERAAAASGTVPDLVEEAHLIRTEVERCRGILDQMSGRAGGAAADEPEWLQMNELLGDVRGRFAPALANRLRFDLQSPLNPVWLPKAGFIQALMSLIKNAFDASDESLPITLAVRQDRNAFRIAVEDHGSGFTPEALRRAGEPFYTTKEAGRGLGLGLFLVRVFAERLGGTLTLQTGHGTTAVMEFPTQPESTGAR